MRVSLSLPLRLETTCIQRSEVVVLVVMDNKMVKDNLI